MKPFGDRGIVVPRGSATASDLRDVRKRLPGCVDYLLTEDEVALIFAERPRVTNAEVAAALRGGAGSVTPDATHSFQARYNGEDVDAVASQCGMHRDDLIALHMSVTYRVAFLGFMPGFAYLRGLPEPLVLPRRRTPRARVPAMSIAIGGPYTGVYPFESAGGWHLLGQLVAPVLFDEELGPRLRHGDCVRFVEAR